MTRNERRADTSGMWWAVLVVALVLLCMACLEQCRPAWAAQNPLVTRDLTDPFLGTTDATSATYNTATGKIDATVTTASRALAMPWAGLSSIPTTVTAPNVTYGHKAHLADVATRAITANNMTWGGLTALPTTSTMAAPRAHIAHLVESVAGAAGLPASASGANPTGTVNGTATNGSAATFMRSNGAPALANPLVPANARQSVTGTLLATGIRTSSIVTSSGLSVQNGYIETFTPAASSFGLKMTNNLGHFFQVSISGSTYSSAVGFEDKALFGSSGGNSMMFYTDGSVANGGTGTIQFRTGGYNSAQERMRILSNGNVGLGVTAATAALHIKAGTTAVGTAPQKFTSGALLATPEAGAVEFLTDNWYATITTGAARKSFVLADGALLTSGRVPVATTGGRLGDFTNFQFDGSRLSAPRGGFSGSVHTSGTLVSTSATTSTIAAVSGNAHTASNAALLGGHTLAQVVALASGGGGVLAVDLTGQTTLSGSTLITGTTVAGQYRIDIYLTQTAGASGASVQMALGWTDAGGARAYGVGAPWSMSSDATATPPASILYTVYSDTTDGITYSWAVSGSIDTATFDVHIRVTPL